MSNRPAPFQICMEKYQRHVPWISHTVAFPCQFPKGHVGPHSWAALQARDEETVNPPEPSIPTAYTDDIAALLEAIGEGEMDPYLEHVLAAAHERKRALRGKRTFAPIRARERSVSGLTPGGSCRG